MPDRYLSKFVSPLNSVVIVTVLFLLGLGLWLNITQQSHGYGSSGGKFADQVSSFSEYLIRNTVLNNIFGEENVGGSLIITKGYGDRDYSYYPDGTIKYYSNRGAQVHLFEFFARVDKEFFRDHSEKFFQAFRLANSLLLVFCFSIFFLEFFGRNLIALFASLTFSLASGLALFSSNLYFMSWMLFTPLLCFPLLARGYAKSYVVLALVFSTLYFAVRYEFATTFALLWLFPLVALRLRGRTVSLRVGVSVFLAVCIGFFVSLLAHHLAVAAEHQFSLAEAASLILKSAPERVASLQDVPAPFTFEFLRRMLSTWNWNGFSVPLLFSVTKFFLLVIFLSLFFVIKDRAHRFLLIWAILAYGSWYVLGYQHIVYHFVYDSLLFAATIQLVLIVSAAELFARFLRSRRIGVAQ